MDTIFALSSGSPPAGIGVVRVSGPRAGHALEALAGGLPTPRRATHRTFVDSEGNAIDDGLVLWLPGPGTATGEDLAELHCHGGRAVIAAIETALGTLDGFRRASPGEFTRRAFANGRMDLAEAEGLADLLAAETELQRRSAQALAGGAFSQQVENWREHLLSLSARVEAALDFSDEDDVDALPSDFHAELAAFTKTLEQWLERPRAERLREGYRVVLAGPPNAGKSTLFNALVEDEAAITSPMEGTTRDAIERSVAIEGIPFTFVDTAGLREGSGDSIELVGIERAREQAGRADLVLWLGASGTGPEGAVDIAAKCDDASVRAGADTDLSISALTGEGMEELGQLLLHRAKAALPKPGEVALHARHHALLTEAYSALSTGRDLDDPLLVGENLRLARLAFDRLIGRTSTEDMLDSLFGRFCIGK